MSEPYRSGIFRSFKQGSQLFEELDKYILDLPRYSHYWMRTVSLSTNCMDGVQGGRLQVVHGRLHKQVFGR